MIAVNIEKNKKKSYAVIFPDEIELIKGVKSARVSNELRIQQKKLKNVVVSMSVVNLVPISC